MTSTVTPADIVADGPGLYIDIRTNFERAVTDIEAIQATSQVVLSGTIADLEGTGVTRFVAPVAGTITAAYTVINGALTTGNATVTLAIGATPVTNGVITITQSDSAAGDIDTCAPTAARTVAAGNLITATVGGTNDATVSAELFIVISRY